MTYPNDHTPEQHRAALDRMRRDMGLDATPCEEPAREHPDDRAERLYEEERDAQAVAETRAENAGGAE